MQNFCQTWGPSDKNQKELDDDSVGTIQVPNHDQDKETDNHKKIKTEKATNKYLGYKEIAIFLQNWFDEVEDFKRENINPFK